MFPPLCQQISLTAIAFRLLLAVSLWQGPILWGHQHDGAMAGLSAHLAQFHPSDADPMELGWHWHLSLPERNGSSPSEDSEQPNPPLAKVAVHSASGLTMGTWSLAVPVEFDEQAISSWVSVRAGGGFLASFCPAHTPQQLLCRLHC